MPGGYRGRLSPPAQAKHFPLSSSAPSVALSIQGHQETQSPDSPVSKPAPGKQEALEQGSVPTPVSWGSGARTQRGQDGKAEQEWKEMSCLRSVKAQSDLLWEDLGGGGAGEVGNSIAKTTRGSTVGQVYPSCRCGPSLPRWRFRTARKDIRGDNQSSVRRSLEWKIVIFWVPQFLAFQRPQTVFSVPFAPRPHRFSVAGRTQTLESGQPGFESQL